jgi:hypothetical protein
MALELFRKGKRGRLEESALVFKQKSGFAKNQGKCNSGDTDRIKRF